MWACLALRMHSAAVDSTNECQCQWLLELNQIQTLAIRCAVWLLTHCSHSAPLSFCVLGLFVLLKSISEPFCFLTCYSLVSAALFKLAYLLSVCLCCRLNWTERLFCKLLHKSHCNVNAWNFRLNQAASCCVVHYEQADWWAKFQVCVSMRNRPLVCLSFISILMNSVCQFYLIFCFVFSEAKSSFLANN